MFLTSLVVALGTRSNAVRLPLCPPRKVWGYEQLLRRNVKRFRGGLVFKAHRLVYRWRVINKGEEEGVVLRSWGRNARPNND